MRKLSTMRFLYFMGATSLLAEKPLQQRDQWQVEDPAAWEWQGEGEATTLALKKPSQYKPKVRRPFDLAWFGGAEWGAFTLTCETKLDVFNKGNNDVCIAFAGRGESDFYHAHLGLPGPALQTQLGEPHGVVTHPRNGDIDMADSRKHGVRQIKASSSPIKDALKSFKPKFTS